MECSQDEVLREMLKLKREFEEYCYKVNETQTHLMNQDIPSTIKEDNFEELKRVVWRLSSLLLQRADNISENRDCTATLLREAFNITPPNATMSILVGEPDKYETKKHFRHSTFADYLSGEELGFLCEEFNYFVEICKRVAITVIEPS